MRKILVTILNFKQNNYVINLIQDLLKQKGDNEFFICVGDIQPKEKDEIEIKENINQLRNNFIQYYAIQDNLGYAKGNNFLIRKGTENYNPDYILVTNPDITLEKDDIIEKLAALLEEEKKCAVVGPKVVLSNGRQQGPYTRQNPFIYGGKHIFPFIWKIFHKSRECKIAEINEIQVVWRIIGAFMLLKAEVFYNVGLFDEDTFLYWEEDLLSLKLDKIGYKTLFYPHTKVTHLHQITGKHRNLFVEKHAINSMKIYFRKAGYSSVSILFAVLGKNIYDKFWKTILDWISDKKSIDKSKL